MSNRPAPLSDRLPILEARKLPKVLASFAGRIYTPAVHNEMREMLTTAGETGDLDAIISTFTPAGDIAGMAAFQAAVQRAAPGKPKPAGPNGVDRLCDLFEELGLPLKAPPFTGDYVIADGKGRVFSLIEAFIEVTRRMTAAEARLDDLEKRG
jgi:hypothetical protein